MGLPASDQNLHAVHADVAVVGYGPVGMVLAGLLGRRGHRVVVLERYPGLYNLPRAGVFDDETMRTFAALGVAEQLLPNLLAPQRYWFQNGAGERLIEFDLAEFGYSGWAEMYGFYQPDLENALDRVCRDLPQIDVRHSARVTALEQDRASVTLNVTSPGRRHGHLPLCRGVRRRKQLRAPTPRNRSGRLRFRRSVDGLRLQA